MKYNVIGIMSGTSLDGLDLAAVQFEFSEEGKWIYEIKYAETAEYDPKMKERLQNVTHLDGLNLIQLDHDLGELFGKKIKDFINNNNLNVNYIASHGHTVFHQPENNFTYQIGNPYNIYKQTKIPVIADFRKLDVALGGQGAPLVPVGDQLLFWNHDFCLNLGGIGNISCDMNGSRIAYDICAVNMVLNFISSKLMLPYDKGGKLARSGRMIDSLKHKLDQLDFYDKDPPKTLGYEWVEKNILSLFGSDAGADELHTYSHHIAEKISGEIKELIKKDDHMISKEKSLLVTGGGAYNSFLIEQIEIQLKEHVKVVIPDDQLINFKEALIFGFMGVLRIRNEINVLKSVTGSETDTSSGVIYSNFID